MPCTCKCVVVSGPAEGRHPAHHQHPRHAGLPHQSHAQQRHAVDQVVPAPTQLLAWSPAQLCGTLHLFATSKAFLCSSVTPSLATFSTCAPYAPSATAAAPERPASLVTPAPGITPASCSWSSCWRGGGRGGAGTLALVGQVGHAGLRCWSYVARRPWRRRG